MMRSINSFPIPTTSGITLVDIPSSSRRGRRRQSVVSVEGEIDVSNACRVASAAAALITSPSDVVIDLHAMSFIPSRALWLVTELPDIALSHGVGCAVVTSPALDRLFEILGRVCPDWVYDDIDTAMNAIQNRSQSTSPGFVDAQQVAGGWNWSALNGLAHSGFGQGGTG